MFFFSIGATFDFTYLKDVYLPAIILGTAMITIKPLLYWKLLAQTGEDNQVSLEVGMRLGQASEFSLLVAGLALSSSLLSLKAASLIKAATIFSFIVSSYIIVLFYPTPIALTDSMRKD